VVLGEGGNKYLKIKIKKAMRYVMTFFLPCLSLLLQGKILSSIVLNLLYRSFLIEILPVSE